MDVRSRPLGSHIHGRLRLHAARRTGSGPRRTRHADARSVLAGGVVDVDAGSRVGDPNDGGSLRAGSLRWDKEVTFGVGNIPLLTRRSNTNDSSNTKLLQMYDLPALTAFGRPLLVRRGMEPPSSTSRPTTG